LFKESAEEGDAEAKYMLGLMYFEGKGVKQNKEKGIKYITRAAKDGDNEAQFEVGKWYYEGSFKKKNLRKAIKFLKSSANQGNEDSLMLLGKIYEEKAIEMYQRAKDAGHENAIMELEKFEKHK